MTNKFKKGDKVVRVVLDFKEVKVGETYTVSRVPCSDSIKLVGFGDTTCDSMFFMHERDFVEMCTVSLLQRAINLELFGGFGPNKYYKCSLKTERGNELYRVSVDTLLDKLYPTETPEQKELRQLEEEQRKLAERIAAVREKL